MEAKPRTEFVEFLKRLKECPDFIVNSIDTVGPPPEGNSAELHIFVGEERLRAHAYGPPQLYEVVDFAESAREWLPRLLEERERLRRELVRLKECAGTDPVTLTSEIDRILAGVER